MHMTTFILLADFQLYLGGKRHDAMQLCLIINILHLIKLALLGFEGFNCPIKVSVSSPTIVK